MSSKGDPEGAEIVAQGALALPRPETLLSCSQKRCLRSGLTGIWT
jgi:hypothetical protein